MDLVVGLVEGAGDIVLLAEAVDLLQVLGGAGDLPYFSAIATTRSSSSLLPRARGEYASTTMPFWWQRSTSSSRWQNGWTSIWLTAGTTEAFSSRPSRSALPKFETPMERTRPRRCAISRARHEATRFSSSSDGEWMR